MIPQTPIPNDRRIENALNSLYDNIQPAKKEAQLSPKARIKSRSDGSGVTATGDSKPKKKKTSSEGQGPKKKKSVGQTGQNDKEEKISKWPMISNKSKSNSNNNNNGNGNGNSDQHFNRPINQSDDPIFNAFTRIMVATRGDAFSAPQQGQPLPVTLPTTMLNNSDANEKISGVKRKNHSNDQFPQQSFDPNPLMVATRGEAFSGPQQGQPLPVTLPPTMLNNSDANEKNSGVKRKNHSNDQFPPQSVDPNRLGTHGQPPFGVHPRASSTQQIEKSDINTDFTLPLSSASFGSVSSADCQSMNGPLPSAANLTLGDLFADDLSNEALDFVKSRTGVMGQSSSFPIGVDFDDDDDDEVEVVERPRRKSVDEVEVVEIPTQKNLLNKVEVVDLDGVEVVDVDEVKAVEIATEKSLLGLIIGTSTMQKEKELRKPWHVNAMDKSSAETMLGKAAQSSINANGKASGLLEKALNNAQSLIHGKAKGKNTTEKPSSVSQQSTTMKLKTSIDKISKTNTKGSLSQKQPKKATKEASSKNQPQKQASRIKRRLLPTKNHKKMQGKEDSLQKHAVDNYVAKNKNAITTPHALGQGEVFNDDSLMEDSSKDLRKKCLVSGLSMEHVGMKVTPDVLGTTGDASDQRRMIERGNTSQLSSSRQINPKVFDHTATDHFIVSKLIPLDGRNKDDSDVLSGICRSNDPTSISDLIDRKATEKFDTNPKAEQRRKKHSSSKGKKDDNPSFKGTEKETTSKQRKELSSMKADVPKKGDRAGGAHMASVDVVIDSKPLASEGAARKGKKAKIKERKEYSDTKIDAAQKVSEAATDSSLAAIGSTEGVKKDGRSSSGRKGKKSETKKRKESSPAKVDLAQKQGDSGIHEALGDVEKGMKGGNHSLREQKRKKAKLTKQKEFSDTKIDVTIIDKGTSKINVALRDVIVDSKPIINGDTQQKKKKADVKELRETYDTEVDSAKRGSDVRGYHAPAGSAISYGKPFVSAFSKPVRLDESEKQIVSRDEEIAASCNDEQPDGEEVQTKCDEVTVTDENEKESNSTGSASATVDEPVDIATSQQGDEEYNRKEVVPTSVDEMMPCKNDDSGITSHSVPPSEKTSVDELTPQNANKKCNYKKVCMDVIVVDKRYTSTHQNVSSAVSSHHSIDEEKEDQVKESAFVEPEVLCKTKGVHGVNKSEAPVKISSFDFVHDNSALTPEIPSKDEHPHETDGVDGTDNADTSVNISSSDVVHDSRSAPISKESYPLPKREDLRETEYVDESDQPELSVKASYPDVAHDSSSPISKNHLPLSDLCQVIHSPESNHAPLSYPYAPMGQLWLENTLRGNKFRNKSDCENGIDVKAGGTLIGRRWVWDEGHYSDGHLDSGLGRILHLLGQSGSDNMIAKSTSPISMGCTCGANHVAMKESSKKSSITKNDGSFVGRMRRSERSSSSTRMSNVVAQLADGRLNPHTLIACEDYSWGPEFRFVKDAQTENVQPYSVRVSPDATFLADLHAHLCDSEIIGFLGGYYSTQEKCIYVQAAFPCKSTNRPDAGHTDVEMDPMSQVHAREAIANHGMSVVGWYHSHPTFQPDPSVTDIENQASYQQLFKSNLEGQSSTENKPQSVHDCDSSVEENSTNTDAGNEKSDLGRDGDVPFYRRAGFISPFVGLIVGTYDAKNPSSQSVMRWFHVTTKYTENGKFVDFPMNLKTTNRHFRKFPAASGFGVKEACRLRQAMTLQSAEIRQELESRYLSCPLTDFGQVGQQSVETNDENRMINVESLDERTTIDSSSPTAKQRQLDNKIESLQQCGVDASETAQSKDNSRKENDLPGSSNQSDADNVPLHANVNASSTVTSYNAIDVKTEKSTQDQSNEKIKDKTILLPQTPLAFSHGNTQSTDHIQNMMEKDPNTLILSESLFEQNLGSKNDAEGDSFESARPLYFTMEEKTILEMSTESISYDVLGGIIWHAIERDQQISQEYNMDDLSGHEPLDMPASSRSILELLLRKSFSGNDLFDRKLYEMIQCIGENGSAIIGDDVNFNDSNAAITHSVDVVLSHYASKSKRVNPFTTWSGAGDKGTVIKDSASSTYINFFWRDFYMTKILRMTPSTSNNNGVKSYQGGNKMKRGHKMTACLLRWAYCMELSPGFDTSCDERAPFSYDLSKHENGVSFDHEKAWLEERAKAKKEIMQGNNEHVYIYFVAEIMRLLAARWREGRIAPPKRAKPTSSLPTKKRGRPKTSESSGIDTSSPKRGPGRPPKKSADKRGSSGRSVGRPRKSESV